MLKKRTYLLLPVLERNLKMLLGCWFLLYYVVHLNDNNYKSACFVIL